MYKSLWICETIIKWTQNETDWLLCSRSSKNKVTWIVPEVVTFKNGVLRSCHGQRDIFLKWKITCLFLKNGLVSIRLYIILFRRRNPHFATSFVQGESDHKRGYCRKCYRAKNETCKEATVLSETQNIVNLSEDRKSYSTGKICRNVSCVLIVM